MQGYLSLVQCPAAPCVCKNSRFSKGFHGKVVAGREGGRIAKGHTYSGSAKLKL